MAYGKEAYPGIRNEGGRGSQVYYKEDVFVGYRGFERNKTKALFPFGFGLSYTTFDIDRSSLTIDHSPLTIDRSPLTIDHSNADGAADNGQCSMFNGQCSMFNVQCKVTNTGSVAGKEVVQVYVSAPKNKQIAKPLKELKAFAKTRLLQPGESETLQMTIPARDLASWDEATHQWQVDNGTYTFLVGTSSADIKAKATYTISK